MRRAFRNVAFGALLVGVIGAAGLVGRQALALPDAPAPAALDATKTMAQNLATQKGKTVTLHLASGESLSGTVDAWGSEVVHLKGLTGKEFYDAVIRLDAIVAIEARVAK